MEKFCLRVEIKEKKGLIYMIKGCEKRVVWLRNTESDIFEQAYFILSEASRGKSCTESDIVAEAKRIIGRTPVSGWWEEAEPETKKRRHPSALVKFAFFVLGFSIGAIPLALLLILP